jgi:hypothetical protein
LTSIIFITFLQQYLAAIFITIKKMKMRILQSILFSVLLISIGCSSSKITTTWKAPVTPTKNYTKILVLGVINDKDKRVQQLMEQHFVGDLTNLGYNAISALQQYGPKAFENLSEKEALEKIKTSGADAVLTIVLLDKQKERKYIPPQPVYYRPFWDYYGYRYGRIYEPGYYVTDTKYFWESNFYDMSNQSLLYSVQTKSFSPNSTESMGHEYGLMIVKNMVKQNILQQKIEKEE